MSEPEAKLSQRTLAMRRAKLGEVLLEAHALLRLVTLPAGDATTPELLPLATRARLIALLAAAFAIITEGWSL